MTGGTPLAAAALDVALAVVPVVAVVRHDSADDAERIARAAVRGGARVVEITGVLARVARRGVAAIPGAFTPTEVARAADEGAHSVKLFPARVLGTGFVSALRDVMPSVKLMPTGGIGPAEVAAWLDAGATAVGIAGALGTAWRRGGHDEVEQTIRAAIAAATNRSTS